jgi:hypothetical protein
MIITVPIFMPAIMALGFDPIWFGAIMLLNMQMGTLSPPLWVGFVCDERSGSFPYPDARYLSGCLPYSRTGSDRHGDHDTLSSSRVVATKYDDQII